MPTMPDLGSKLSRTTSEQEIEISMLEAELHSELNQISKLRSRIQSKLNNISLPNMEKCDNQKHLNELESWASRDSISYFTLQTTTDEPTQVTTQRFTENNLNIFVKETSTQVAKAKALTMQIIS
jgi:hypothetical protein